MVNPDPRGLLPEAVAQELLGRWGQPHRHYHGPRHLAHGLEALETLGGGRLEAIAFWFHDAVHTNTTPQDEEASAALVHAMLSNHEPPASIREIQRLVMLTSGHVTDADDPAGQRMCDADLSSLGADEITYRHNVAGIRAELPHLSDHQWVTGRSRFLERFLQREHLFATSFGRRTWETPARRNFERELAELASPSR